MHNQERRGRLLDIIRICGSAALDDLVHEVGVSESTVRRDLDGGTTTYELACLLVGRSLQVVTNSIPVANLFASEARTDLVLLGGYASPRTGICLGPYASELLGRLHVTTTRPPGF